MAAKEILFDEAGRARILAGVNTLADAVKVTLGPERPQRRHREVLGLAHGHQGRRHRRQGDRARGQVREHGRADGEGGRLQDHRRRRRRHHHRDRARAGDLPRGREAWSPRATTRWRSSAASTRRSSRSSRRCKKIAKPTKGQKDIAQVGTISANGDKSIGKMLAEAMEKVGKEGVITVEEAKTMETTLDVVEGMQFDRGYLSPYFVTDPERMEVKLEDALHPHPREEDLEHEGSAAGARAGRARRQAAAHHRRGVEGEALATLVVNKLRGTLQRRAPSRRRASAIAARRC